MQSDTSATALSRADDFQLYNYARAAEFLAVTPVALRNKVYRGQGPTPTVIERRTFFALCDLREYVLQHRRPAAPAVKLSLAEVLAPPKRRRGRPTVAEMMARQAVAKRGEG